MLNTRTEYDGNSAAVNDTAGNDPDQEVSIGQRDEIIEGTVNNVGDIIEDADVNRDDSLTNKSFKERAAELMRKSQGENSHLVSRKLEHDDWLVIHRIIRKSKGLKSKYMIRNLKPFLFDPKYVTGWKCKVCMEVVLAPAENYVSHLESHGCQPDDDPLFPCDVCGDYIKREKYVVHWVPHFMEHECPICRKNFALHCHMKYHYKVVHDEGEQTCFHCGKLMKNDLAMRRHLRLFHSNRTTWKICDICGKRVKSRCLEPHKLTHREDRPYKCEVCKNCFKTPSTLYQHQKVHATDSKAHKYLCEYCGKRFKHHTSWNLHVVRIHKGEYEHECPVCHKRFHKLFELKKHSVKHSEERPFPCTICGKPFKTKTHLKEHSTTHSEEKSHICPLCGKAIRMKANLYKHLKVHRNRGEYVPPLNGSSTNALFNNFGVSTSVVNTQNLQTESSVPQPHQQSTSSCQNSIMVQSSENTTAMVQQISSIPGSCLQSAIADDNDVEVTLSGTLLSDGSLLVTSDQLPIQSDAATTNSSTHFLIINTCGTSGSENHRINSKSTSISTAAAVPSPISTVPINEGVISFITPNSNSDVQGPVTHLTILLSNSPIGGITLSQAQTE